MILTTENMLANWKQDVIIDETQLQSEILKVPMLHSKYLEYYMYFCSLVSRSESAKNRMGHLKRDYYRGNSTEQTLKEYGWKQYQGLKLSLSELNQALEFDLDMIKLNQVVSDMKSAVKGSEYILGQLKNREYSLKGIIEYQKYLTGN